MSAEIFTVVRALHVLAAALWVGAAVLNALFLVPAVLAAGPAGGQVMRLMIQVRRLPVYMNTVMLVTLLTGLYVMDRVSGHFHPSWLASGPGIALTTGALLAFVTAGIGFFVTVPTVKKIGALGAAMAAAGGPPDPARAAEMGRLQRRMLRMAQVGSLLIVLATILMAVARFV